MSAFAGFRSAVLAMSSAAVAVSPFVRNNAGHALYRPSVRCERVLTPRRRPHRLAAEQSQAHRRYVMVSPCNSGCTA